LQLQVVRVQILGLTVFFRDGVRNAPPVWDGFDGMRSGKSLRILTPVRTAEEIDHNTVS
jgi:hypothetical protein